MEKVLQWTQGGEKHLVFVNQIIMIVENERKYCEIHLVGFEEPIKSSLSLEEIRKQLGIKS